MSNLSLAEIKKRPGRIETLLSKLIDGSPFELVGSKKFIANSLRVYSKNNLIAFTPKKKNDSEFISALEFISKKATSSEKIFISDGKKEQPLSSLIKNHEFGGKGEGASLKAEDAAIRQTREYIEMSISKNKGPIKIKCGNKVYENITAVEKTNGTPKSDFHLIDTTGKPVIWISHKDGSRSKDFQQWGGISERKEPKIFNHKETQKFIDDLKKVYPEGLPAATTVYRHIEDEKLKMLSVYGNEYGSKLGEQNVSVLLQGPISLKKSGNFYTLHSNHVHYNGDSVDGDGYDPVLMAIYKGDRSDAGVKGTRIVISPIGGRKGVEFK
jgi:hypothetical protein